MRDIGKQTRRGVKRLRDGARYARCLAQLAAVALLATTAVAAPVAGSVPGDETLRPDLAREQRMADEIRDAILDGEPLMLHGADGHAFLAIHTEATGAARGTVIVLHGRGFHPDWVDVVQPLRVGLTEHGWHTLSIQLPVLDKQAKYYDYVQIFDSASPRIEAAIEKARALADGPVVLAAHSCGNHMAQHWILTRGAAAVAMIDAFIGIGMGATDLGQPMRVPFALDLIDGPVLDLYAENDFRAVLRLAPQRLAAMRRAGNAKSAQRAVPDSEHYFVDRGDVLTGEVARWLQTLW